MNLLKNSREIISSSLLASKIHSEDFSHSVATVVGYGHMGKHYVQALQKLGFKKIRICSTMESQPQGLKGFDNVDLCPGGFKNLKFQPEPNELGIVATPTQLLVPASKHLISLGFKRLLIEKPVSLWSKEIRTFAEFLEGKGIEVACGYNRLCYPSFLEVLFRATKEGGISSCHYVFTEMIKPDWPERFAKEELARWGVANSLHVISMAHGLIGLPKVWTSYRTGGSLSWHPTGSNFVGAGITQLDIPFSFHADWGSVGRWSLEIHTHVASYRLCPLEKVFRRKTALAEWEEIPITVFDSQLKSGILEEVALMMEPKENFKPLLSLFDAASITSFSEEIFGYV